MRDIPQRDSFELFNKMLVSIVQVNRKTEDQFQIILKTLDN